MPKAFHMWVDSGPSYGIGISVGQLDDDESVYRPIAFASRRSSEAENKFWAPEMELRGIKYAVTEKFRYFVAQSVREVMWEGTRPENSQRDASLERAMKQTFIRIRGAC